MSEIERVELQGYQYASLRKPAVYQTFEGDECTYVGFTGWGFDRVFNQNTVFHPSRFKAFQDASRILTVFYDSATEASEREIILIHELHPRYNKVCSVCGATHPNEIRVQVRAKSVSPKIKTPRCNSFNTQTPGRWSDCFPDQQINERRTP